jgi:hypothetical protein
MGGAANANRRQVMAGSIGTMVTGDADAVPDSETAE